MSKQEELLTDKEKVQAQYDYIETTGKRTGVRLDFPLQGYHREDCFLQAQLAKATKILKQTGIPNYNNTGKWLIDLDKARHPKTQQWI